MNCDSFDIEYDFSMNGEKLMKKSLLRDISCRNENA